MVLVKHLSKQPQIIILIVLLVTKCGFQARGFVLGLDTPDPFQMIKRKLVNLEQWVWGPYFFKATSVGNPDIFVQSKIPFLVGQHSFICMYGVPNESQSLDQSPLGHRKITSATTTGSNQNSLCIHKPLSGFIRVKDFLPLYL